MKLLYKENLKFPDLAWIAAIQDGTATVIHGLKVETMDNFFVEGAWGGGIPDS